MMFIHCRKNKHLLRCGQSQGLLGYDNSSLNERITSARQLFFGFFFFLHYLARNQAESCPSAGEELPEAHFTAVQLRC